MNSNMKYWVWGAATLLGCLGFAVSAQAASFDCAKASTKVEHIICDNPKISKLDDDLAASYKTALQDQSKAEVIKQEQKQWLKERNGCADTACVRQAYVLRLLFLARSEKRANTDEAQAYYVLMMSEDDSVCKPILAAYNRDILLDLPKSRPPHPYPWPVPPELAVNWKVKPWNKSIPENERSLLERMYSYIEVDINGDGETETVVRWASWLRGEDRFSDLDIFPHGTVLSDDKEIYRSQADKTTNVSGGPAGGYSFPKLKERALSGTLNDFDVIQYNGKYYVTGKTVEMDGIVEVRDEPQWRVISRVRDGKPTTHQESDNDVVLDSICYFKLKISK